METFIKQFKEALERDGVVRMEDQFREYEEWDSVAYLSIIAFMDENYNTQIEEEDFKKILTVQDLFNACTKK